MLYQIFKEILTLKITIELSAVIEAFEAFVAFANLLVVIYIFYCEKKDAENRAEINRKKEWFDAIVIERVIGELDDFFLFTNKQVINAKKNVKQKEILGECIDEFNARLYRVKHEILPAIKMFDKGMHKDVRILLEDFSSFYTENLESSFQKGYFGYQIEDKPDEYKYKIFTRLYTYEIKINE